MRAIDKTEQMAREALELQQAGELVAARFLVERAKVYGLIAVTEAIRGMEYEMSKR